MNKKLTTPLFLLASFLLIGCSTDTIVARPSWQNDKIVEGNLKDNKMKAIYDAIKNLGDTNANVLSKVMTDIATSHIGEIEKLREYGRKTNLDDIKALIATPDFKNFVNTHSIYKADTEGGLRDANTPAQTKSKELDEEQKGLTSFYKIQQQYELIVEDVYERLYNEIKGGSYSTSKTKLFQEELFVEYLIKELYEVDITGVTLSTDKVFMSKAKDVSWKNYVNVHTDAFGNKVGYLNVTDSNGELTGIYGDYIKRKILPEVYKTLLTETYVREQRYSSLGRSYARKVNMVSITTDDTNRFAVPKMLKKFAETYIIDSGKTQNYDFEYISKAMIGIIDTNDTITQGLLTDTFNPMKVLDGTEKEIKFKLYTDKNGVDVAEASRQLTPVYEGTKLGELVSKIIKCCDIKVDSGTQELTYSRKRFMNADQQKIYDELTGNGAYKIEKGIKLKEREIRQTDYTKDGWFLKNGGLTDISSTVRDRLFNITTSTQIDDYARKAGTSSDAKDYIKYFGKTDTTQNVQNRKAFLTMPAQSGSDVDRIVLNEAGNSNYYIIEVEEAVNTSKLSKASNRDSYIRTKSYTSAESEAYKSTVEYNKLVRDIVKVNSSSDTYKKNANEYYLMISNIVFYDQSVYDYFKSQFPDLFK